MKITISKNDFKKEPEKKPREKKQSFHEKTASLQAKNYIRRENTYRLEEKQKVKYNLTNFAFLMYFLFVVGVAVLVASVWKLIITYSQNSFDTSSYAVLIKQDNNDYVIALNKSLDALFIIKTTSQKENRLQNSFTSKIPLDAMITVKETETPLDLFTYPKLASYFIKISGVHLIQMTAFDYMNMVFTVSGMDNKNKHEVSLELHNGEWSLSQEELFDIFKDSEIIHEGLGVEVVNATETNGFAGNVANILEPIGVNIVSLSSEGKVKRSVIKVRNVSKTAQRISHILEIPIIQEDPSSIADITIILGEDFEKKIQ